MTTRISATRLDKSQPLPTYAREGDAGLDLVAAHEINIPAGQTRAVSTGLAVALPAGHVGLIHPRSGLAAKHGITVLNAPGTIDSGYRGEIKVLLWNTSTLDFRVRAGDRIAQMVVQEFVTVELFDVESLDESERGGNGFGSTGVAS